MVGMEQRGLLEHVPRRENGRRCIGVEEGLSEWARLEGSRFVSIWLGLHYEGSSPVATTWEPMELWVSPEACVVAS